MKYRAEINIMPLKELLDPQGKTVARNMHNVQIDGITDVRIGKHIHMELEADTAGIADDKIREACKKVLANPIIESYSFEIFPME